jgi:hypothetical protein
MFKQHGTIGVILNRLKALARPILSPSLAARGQMQIGLVLFLGLVVVVALLVLLGPQIAAAARRVGEVIPNTLYPTPVP